MNNLLTPIAILISGILIALVLVFNGLPRYKFVSYDEERFIRQDTISGEVCVETAYVKGDIDNTKVGNLKICDE
jgi:uncharacterized membrane protein YqiK